MLRLIALILLLVPGVAFSQTLKLPAEIVPERKLVVVTPEYEGKVLDTKFVVFGDKSKPEYYSAGNTLLMVAPEPGDVITIVAVAMFEGPVLAPPVVCRVLPLKQPGTTPGTPPPVNPPTASIPATGIHVIVVVDPASVPADLAQLGQGQNAITRHVAGRQSYWYLRNSTDSLLERVRPSFAGKQLPVLLVINSSKQVVLAESFTPTGDVTQTANLILSKIAPK